jgi:hypothetical protein
MYSDLQRDGLSPKGSSLSSALSGSTGEMETQGTATAFKPWEPPTSPKPSEPPSSAGDVSADAVHAAELLTELAAGALPVAAAWKQVGDKRQRDYELLDAGAAADRSPKRHRPGAITCLEVLFGRKATEVRPFRLFPAFRAGASRAACKSTPR